MENILHELLTTNLGRIMVELEERKRWMTMWKQIAQYLKTDSLGASAETMALLQCVSHDQMILAESMQRLEIFAANDREDLSTTLDAMTLKPVGSGTTLPKRCSTDNDEEIDPRSKVTEQESSEEADEHLRDWYVTHLPYPFPDKPDKQDLAATIHYTKEQLNTWFTNMRRRSGYTEYLRTFAGGNKKRFEEMIGACLDGQVGVGGKELMEAVEDMRKYVAKRPRGKVGEWLMNLMEEEQTVEANPRKKRRVETDTSDDIKPSKSEQTLAPPASIKPPTADAPTTPIAKVKAKKAQTPKKIKTYTFSVGASDCLSATPSDSKRGPLGSPFRSSPLRTVSTNSTSSLETVDSGLRSVSGLSSTGSLTSNISSDLNFSFPTYNVNTPLPPAHSMDLPTVILTPPAPITNLPPTMQQQFQPRPQNQQTLYTFGLPGNSQFTFNPNLPHTVQPAPNYHLAISNSSYSTFPQQMVGPLSQFGVATPGLKGLQQRQQEYMPYQTSSGLRFSDGFGTTTTMIAMKRSIGEVGGVLVDERAWKVPRFEEV